LRISTEEGNKGMFNFGNGKTLIDLIPDDLSHAATSFVESLKINSITEKSRRDPPCPCETSKTFTGNAQRL
jgi:hypothetical protein